MKTVLQKILQKVSCLMLCAVLVCAMLPARAEASFEIPGTYLVQADSHAACVVKTLDYNYDNNTYFSLRDIAMAFKGTDKAFSLEITKNSVLLNQGQDYQPVGVENAPWADVGNPNISLKKNEFKVNGQKVIYYTLIMKLPSGHYDCFMMAADLAMILDVDISVPTSGFLQVNTRNPFYVSPVVLEQAGYFYGVNSVLVGDATTGEIYYSYQADTPYPIASISKLMTYLLAMDALSAGQITLEQQVTVSYAAQLLSASEDGVVPLTAGQQITVKDLLVAALLPSSNECVLCLAETIAGSEDAFVQMMNRKVMDLGMSGAVFFNSHGLPSYSEDPVPAKRQNRMSAEDMFKMVSYILKVYPQVTDTTSRKTATLESIGVQVRNTNPLLHNMSEVNGLKTGTTNKAGACLVTSMSVNDGVMDHDLVVIVLGTENSTERGRVSALMAKYALHAFYTGMERAEAGVAARSLANLPTHAEMAVGCILRTAKRHAYASENIMAENTEDDRPAGQEDGTDPESEWETGQNVAWVIGPGTGLRAAAR